MRHYIVWLSSKGIKEIYSITDSYELAKWYRDQNNEFYKQNEIKRRSYITYCDDGKTYFHNEIKKESK